MINIDNLIEIDKDWTANVLALTSILVQDFMAKRGMDYDYAKERMINFEGKTGPYLQYQHTRCYSIERKFLLEYDLKFEDLFDENVLKCDKLVETQVKELIMVMGRNK